MRRPDGFGEQFLEARAGRAERETARAEHFEHELLVAFVDPRAREPYRARSDTHLISLRQAYGYARVMLGTSSRHWAQRSLTPRTVSR